VPAHESMNHLALIQQVAALKSNLSFLDFGWWNGEDTCNRLQKSRLPAPSFPHEADSLSAVYGEVHILQNSQDALIDAVRHREVMHR